MHTSTHYTHIYPHIHHKPTVFILDASTRKHPPPAKNHPRASPVETTRRDSIRWDSFAHSRVRTARLVAPALASLDVRRFKHSQTLPTHDGGPGPGEAQGRGEETGGEEETSGEEEARGEEDDGDEEEGGAEEEAGGCVYVTRR